MQLANVVLCVYLLVLSESFAYYYPPVFWHYKNCVFRKLRESYGTNQTKEYFMKVLPQQRLRIVCPSDVTINDWLETRGLPKKYQNLWLVDKNGYDNCKVNDDTNPSMNKLLLTCNSPQKILYKTFQFHPRFNMMSEPRFVPGRHYYFIATGDGTSKTLKDKSGGHCKDYYMKLHIYVCNPEKETCIWEQPYCEPTYEFDIEMRKYSRNLPLTSPSNVPQTRPATSPIVKSTMKAFKQDTTSNPIEVVTTELTNPIPEGRADTQCDTDDGGDSVHMILNFVLGGIILFMAVVIVILSCGLARKSETTRPASGAFSAISTQEPNGNLYQESGRYVHPTYTTASKSPPQTPISVNQPLYFAPMAEIRPRTSSNRNGFNNVVYGVRQDSVDVHPDHIEVAPMLPDHHPNAPEPV